MTYKAIIFDFFDVIHADPFQAWMNNHGQTREGPAGRVSEDIDHGKIDAQEFFRRLAEVTSQTVQAVMDEFQQAERLDDATVALIKKIRQHYKVGLISNAESAFIRDLFTRHQLDELFDFVVVSSEVGHIKPSPEIFHIALEKAGVSPQEAIFTDDNPKNVAAAQALGIQAVVFKSARQLATDLRSLGVNA